MGFSQPTVCAYHLSFSDLVVCSLRRSLHEKDQPQISTGIMNEFSLMLLLETAAATGLSSPPSFKSYHHSQTFRDAVPASSLLLLPPRKLMLKKSVSFCKWTSFNCLKFNFKCLHPCLSVLSNRFFCKLMCHLQVKFTAARLRFNLRWYLNAHRNTTCWGIMERHKRKMI